MNPLTIKCRRCDKETYFFDFAGTADLCAKSRCWLKRDVARIEVARLTNKSPDDFILVQKGTIILHKEDDKQYYPVADNDVASWM